MRRCRRRKAGCSRVYSFRGLSALYYAVRRHDAIFAPQLFESTMVRSRSLVETRREIKQSKFSECHMLKFVVQRRNIKHPEVEISWYLSPYGTATDNDQESKLTLR